jgi:hypothetical protein
MVKRYGDDAMLEASERADQPLASGNGRRCAIQNSAQPFYRENISTN